MMRRQELFLPFITRNVSRETKRFFSACIFFLRARHTIFEHLEGG